MPVLKKYRCRNCGEQFEIDVLNVEERREAERRHTPLVAIACPKCNRRDVREGWGS